MITVCQITVYPKKENRIRIEGDYVPGFYDKLKSIIPKTARRYFPAGRYWTVDRAYFCRIFQLAYEHFDRIHLFENGKAEIYNPKQLKEQYGNEGN